MITVRDALWINTKEWQADPIVIGLLFQQQNKTLGNVCVHRKGSGNDMIKVLDTGQSMITRFPGKLATV